MLAQLHEPSVRQDFEITLYRCEFTDSTQIYISMTYIHNSRRNFLKGLAATPLLSASVIPVLTSSIGINKENYGSDALSDSSAFAGNEKFSFYDGPQSSLFKEIEIGGNMELSAVKDFVSQSMAGSIKHAPGDMELHGEYLFIFLKRSF